LSATALLAARCFAIYAATAAACLFLAHRWIRSLSIGAALLLAAAPLVLTGKAMATGAVYAPLDIRFDAEPFRSHRQEVGMSSIRTPLLSDVVFSMIPWQKAVRESVRNGRAPLWNRFVAAGEPLLAVQQASALHPFTALGFLLPLGQAWTFQMTARFFLAILSAFLLFREMSCSEAPSLVGALGWGLSDFLVFWIGYSVGNALAPFPLLLLGLLRLSRDANRHAVALTTAALVLIVLGGHPESLFFSVVGGGIFFVADLAAAGRPRLRPIALSLVAGALALGLTAVQLLPLAQALPRTWEQAFRSAYFSTLVKSVPPGESARRAASWLLPFAGSDGSRFVIRRDTPVPAACAGALLLPLAWTALFAHHRYRWPLVACGLAGAALAARLAVVTDVVTRLPLFDVAETDYLVFLAVVSTCGLAALGAERLARGEGTTAFVCGAALTLAGALLIARPLVSGLGAFGLSEEFLRRRLLLVLLPTLVLALALSLLPRRRRAVAVAAVPFLLLATRAAEAGGVYPVCPAAALAPPLRILDPIPRGAAERMVAVGGMFLPNVSALYELEDVRGYQSMTLRQFKETLSLWCAPRGAWWFNQVDDIGRPFLSFLNVRWALAPPDYAPPPGWRLAAAEPAAALFENLRVLPRAFVPARLRVEPDAVRRLELLPTIQDFGRDGVLASGLASSADWQQNGRASVRILSYEGDSLLLDVEAEGPAIVATSLTAWPGWKATLDGSAVPPLSYNHAFLAFHVPEGRHRLELRYRPTSFLAGLGISVLTLVIAVALGSRTRVPASLGRGSTLSA
jgi:hypothetical protein